MARRSLQDEEKGYDLSFSEALDLLDSVMRQELPTTSRIHKTFMDWCATHVDGVRKQPYVRRIEQEMETYAGADVELRNAVLAWIRSYKEMREFLEALEIEDEALAKRRKWILERAEEIR